MNEIKKDWAPLISEIKNLGHFDYVHNPGNAGDALIYLGMYELFESHKIKFNTWNGKSRIGRNIVYSGGGNLVRYYPHCARFLNKINLDWDKFILLPHTVDGHEDLLGNFPTNSTIFLREKVSMDYANSIFPKNVSKILSHDTALFLNKGNTNPKIYWNFPSVGIVMKTKWMLKVLRALFFVRLLKSTLYRVDRESSGKSSSNNFDLSDKLAFINNTHEQQVAIANTFLKILSGKNVVKTNRLHVGIARHILELPCDLYPGNYYKIKAIFDHSIRGENTSINFLDSQKNKL